jgi:hypothetical protein
MMGAMDCEEISTSSASYPRFGGAGTPRCKRSYTARLATLCLLMLGLAACGGRASGEKTYQKAVSKQESCCNGLADPAARQSCLETIVRVDDPAVQSSDANRATYACVERHFTCDPATGTATKASAQAQLDCINDIR